VGRYMLYALWVLGILVATMIPFALLLAASMWWWALAVIMVGMGAVTFLNPVIVDKLLIEPRRRLRE